MPRRRLAFAASTVLAAALCFSLPSRPALAAPADESPAGQTPAVQAAPQPAAPAGDAANVAADAAKQADIRRLLEVSGAPALARQLTAMTTKEMMRQLRATRPNLPTRTLATVERVTAQLMNEKLEAKDGYLDRLVPLYAKTFTQQEVRDMLAFYQSPTGRKVVRVTPELMIAGQKIGQDIAKDILPELKQRLVEALSKEGVVLDKLPD